MATYKKCVNLFFNRHKDIMIPSTIYKILPQLNDGIDAVPIVISRLKSAMTTSTITASVYERINHIIYELETITEELPKVHLEMQYRMKVVLNDLMHKQLELSGPPLELWTEVLSDTIGPRQTNFAIGQAIKKIIINLDECNEIEPKHIIYMIRQNLSGYNISSEIKNDIFKYWDLAPKIETTVRQDKKYLNRYHDDQLTQLELITKWEEVRRARNVLYNDEPIHNNKRPRI